MILLGANVKLAAQNWLDAPGGCGFKKMHRAVDVAVVGDSHGFLSDGVDVRHKFLDIAGAIKEWIVGVQMQVGELSHGISSSLVCGADPTARAGVHNWCSLRKSGLELLPGRLQEDAEAVPSIIVGGNYHDTSNKA